MKKMTVVSTLVNQHHSNTANHQFFTNHRPPSRILELGGTSKGKSSYNV